MEFVIVLTPIILLGWITVKLVRYCCSSRVDFTIVNRFEYEQKVFEEDELDEAYPLVEVDEKDSRKQRLLKRTTIKKRLQIRYAAAAKIEFGTPERTKSNLLAVRDYITRIMRADHVRNCDIMAVINETVARVFVPTEDEIKWQQFIYSEAVDIRHAELNQRGC